jgi:hypothetical protein
MKSPSKMHFIMSPQAFYRKTPSLRLRLRVARLRLGKGLFGVCSAFVRCLFGACLQPFRPILR